jgi:hypothetical protein
MKRIWWGIAGLAIVGSAAAAVLVLRPDPIIPPEIEDRLTSSLLLPDAEKAPVDTASVKYNDQEKLLSYKTAFAGTTILISQQPTPEQFIDIPAAYKKVTDQMNTYKTFESANGTVFLTTPAQMKGRQAAVLNAKGTLLFANPDKYTVPITLTLDHI